MTDYVTVPVEPTEDMIGYGANGTTYLLGKEDILGIYQAMLAARPTNLPEIAQGLVDELRELLDGYAEAIEDIQSWASYASDYFQDKHDLEGCLAQHRGLLERHASGPNLVRVKD